MIYSMQNIFEHYIKSGSKWAKFNSILWKYFIKWQLLEIRSALFCSGTETKTVYYNNIPWLSPYTKEG